MAHGFLIVVKSAQTRNSRTVALCVGEGFIKGLDQIVAKCAHFISFNFIILIRGKADFMSRYDKPLAPRQIAATKDENIDFSDIPELDETFWQQAKVVEPDPTEQT